jgi:hypothetical protein
MNNYNDEVKLPTWILGQTNKINFQTQDLLFTAKTQPLLLSAVQARVLQRHCRKQFYRTYHSSAI